MLKVDELIRRFSLVIANTEEKFIYFNSWDEGACFYHGGHVKCTWIPIRRKWCGRDWHHFCMKRNQCNTSWKCIFFQHFWFSYYTTLISYTCMKLIYTSYSWSFFFTLLLHLNFHLFDCSLHFKGSIFLVSLPFQFLN